VQVKGTYFKLPACVLHDPNPMVCLLNFYIFGITKADPFFYANGDGYLGLGLGNSVDDSKNQYSFLSQLKGHGLIDKKIFSVYTQMKNGTDTPSQIRFGSAD